MAHFICMDFFFKQDKVPLLKMPILNPQDSSILMLHQGK